MGPWAARLAFLKVWLRAPYDEVEVRHIGACIAPHEHCLLFRSVQRVGRSHYPALVSENSGGSPFLCKEGGFPTLHGAVAELQCIFHCCAPWCKQRFLPRLLSFIKLIMSKTAEGLNLGKLTGTRCN